MILLPRGSGSSIEGALHHREYQAQRIGHGGDPQPAADKRYIRGGNDGAGTRMLAGLDIQAGVYTGTLSGLDPSIRI